jgi:hypothetical protein
MNGENKKPTEQKIPYKFIVSFEDLRRDMTSNSRIITSSLRIIFSGYIRPETGKTSDWSWVIKSE